MDGSLIQAIVLTVVSFGIGFGAGWFFKSNAPAKK